MDCSLPGSSVCRIFQARTPEWAAIPLSGGIFPTQGLNPVSCIAGRGLCKSVLSSSRSNTLELLVLLGCQGHPGHELDWACLEGNPRACNHEKS